VIVGGIAGELLEIQTGLRRGWRTARGDFGGFGICGSLPISNSNLRVLTTLCCITLNESKKVIGEMKMVKESGCLVTGYGPCTEMTGE
jgi:hypothetical protein